MSEREILVVQCGQCHQVSTMTRRSFDNCRGCLDLHTTGCLGVLFINKPKARRIAQNRQPFAPIPR